MNCECISKIEKESLEKISAIGKYKKPVKSVRLKGISFQVIGNSMKSSTSSTLEIELEGQKKPVPMTMLHSYCPFCGVKIERGE